MELTGLELTLISGAMATAGAALATLRSQSKSACKECRADCRAQVEERLKAIEAEQDDLAGSMAMKIDILFRMVRSLIVHSDIPKEEQERLLNDRGK